MDVFARMAWLRIATSLHPLASTVDSETRRRVFSRWESLIRVVPADARMAMEDEVRNSGAKKCSLGVHLLTTNAFHSPYQKRVPVKSLPN
jgi:hypothetical protein